MIETILHFDHPSPAPPHERILLVMLPGAGITAQDFDSRGMVGAVQNAALPIDVIAAGPDMSLYLDGDIATAIHHAIVEPALAHGHQRIWLLGISLGGMGALLYAARHAHHLDGMILLAPFLGTQGTIAELSSYGGLAAWRSEQSGATTGEKRLLVWLQNYLGHRPARPALYLGYGQTDRFAPGHRLLANALPPETVVTCPGGHDWDTWLKLCRDIIAIAPFAFRRVAP
jgi:alpha-beta hydrolase superfamily lysophospholipase